MHSGEAVTTHQHFKNAGRVLKALGEEWAVGSKHQRRVQMQGHFPQGVREVTLLRLSSSSLMVNLVFVKSASKE